MPAIRIRPSQALWNVTEVVIYQVPRVMAAAGIEALQTGFRDCRARHRYRRDLRRLLRVGPHMIADIGLSQVQARREADKPFWRP
jgi:uncharacterized protein YjiS (DUF1127 family)